MHLISTRKILLAGILFTFFSSAAQAVIVNYGELGTGSSATVVAGDTTVTGSSTIYYSDSFLTSSNGGLGVQGGGNDYSLDLGETLTFDFDFLVTDVSLTATDISPAGNVTYGFNAFNGTTDLGFFSLPNHVVFTETFDLSALVGQAFDSFTLSLSASAPLGLVIEQIEYTQAQASVPAPASIILMGLGLAGLGFSRKKKLA